MIKNYTNRSKSQLLEEIQRLHTELAAVNLMTEERTTALYISEERFSLAMRGANDGLWDWNLESDEVYYSPRWKSMLGYGENELDNDLNTWANLVPSFPVGFYKIVDEPVGKGAYVSFCPPQDEVFDMAVARNYINTGNCPGGYGMLLKRVFAQAGDTVSINEAGITVNDGLLPNSAQLKTDIDGSEMPQYRLGEKMLGDSEYLLMSDVNPNSFDARYFGLIAHAQIQHVVEPVFTWGK